MALTQHLQGFLGIIKLKANLRKVESFLNFTLNANITLASANAYLKGRVSNFEGEMKGLETWSLDIEALEKLNTKEVKRLKTTFAMA